MNSIETIKALLESPNVNSVEVFSRDLLGDLVGDDYENLYDFENDNQDIDSFTVNWHPRTEFKEGDLVYIEDYGTQTIEKVMHDGYICEEGYLDWGDAQIALLQSKES